MRWIVTPRDPGRPFTIRTAGILLLAVLSACGAQGNETDAADASPRRSVLPTETVRGRVTSLRMNDYLWATISPEHGPPVTAMVGDDPVGTFLDAHQGQALAIEVETDRLVVTETGEVREVRRVSGARLGDLTAAAWWRDLSPADRTAARRRFQAGALRAPAREP